MSQYINCPNKTWTAWDLFRVVLASGFLGEGNGTPFGSSMRVIHVQDSGEPYFCSGNKFTDIDLLARKLVGVDGDDLPAVRVSFGTSGANRIACDNTAKGETNQTLALSVIGKGVDGEPLIRISCANLPS